MAQHYVGHTWYTPTELCHHGGCRCPRQNAIPGSSPGLLAGGGRAEGTQQNARACYTGYRCPGYDYDYTVTCVILRDRHTIIFQPSNEPLERGREFGTRLLLFWLVRFLTAITHNALSAGEVLGHLQSRWWTNLGSIRVCTGQVPTSKG